MALVPSHNKHHFMIKFALKNKHFSVTSHHVFTPGGPSHSVNAIRCATWRESFRITHVLGPFPPPRQWTNHHWLRFEIMACRLIGVNSLSKPMQGYCLIGPLGTNISEILIKIQNFSFMKMHPKISSRNGGHFSQGERSWLEAIHVERAIAMLATLHAGLCY